jgi:hypothetical protein
MSTLGIAWDTSTLVERVIAVTGRRPNLLQIICSEIIRRLAERRTITQGDVDGALDCPAINQALEGWGRFTSDARAARIDRIVVWAMLEADAFDLAGILARLEDLGAAVRAEEVRTSLTRLELAFVLGQERGIYRWRVPLFRDRRRLEVPSQMLADELEALTAGGAPAMPRQ